MIYVYGIFFVFILGTVGHFLYNATKIKVFSFLFANGESIWEHLKLGLTPILIWTLVEKIEMNYTNHLLSITGIQTFAFSISIILFYFIYRVLFKGRSTIYDISSFYISVIISFFTKFLLQNMIELPIFLILFGTIFFIITISSYVYLNRTTKHFWIKKEPIQEEQN